MYFIILYIRIVHKSINITLSVIKSCPRVKGDKTMEQLKYILDKRKREDKKYLFELQKLMDTVSNVKDEELKERIIYQITKCNNRLYELIEEIIRS